MTSRRRDASRGLLLVAGVAATAFVVLTVLVTTRATQGVDVAARGWFRPHDVWGTVQIRVDTVVESLKPVRVVPLFALVAVLACWLRRSSRPGIHAAVLAGSAGALTMLAKVLVDRPDPHGEMTAMGGSFPSGHTIGVLICVGGSLLVLQERPRWWEWALVGLVGLAMGLSLLLQAAHWLTDVVGGLLLGTAVLAAALALRYRSPRAPDPVPARSPASDRRRAGGQR